MIYGAYFTPEDVARATGRSVARIEAARAAGELPEVRRLRGGGWVLPRAAAYGLKYRVEGRRASRFLTKEDVERAVARAFPEAAAAKLRGWFAREIEAEIAVRTFPAEEPERSERLESARAWSAVRRYRRAAKAGGVLLALLGQAILRAEAQVYEPGRAKCLRCGERFEAFDVTLHRTCVTCTHYAPLDVESYEPNGLVVMEVGL